MDFFPIQFNIFSPLFLGLLDIPFFSVTQTSVWYGVRRMVFLCHMFRNLGLFCEGKILLWWARLEI